MGPKKCPACVDSSVLPIFSRCLRWHKNDVSHLITQFGRSSDEHLVSRAWWSTLSNALLRSTSSMRIIVPMESSAYFHLWTSSINARTIDISLTDPYCWGSTWSPAMAVT